MFFNQKKKKEYFCIGSKFNSRKICVGVQTWQQIIRLGYANDSTARENQQLNRAHPSSRQPVFLVLFKFELQNGLM